MRLTVLGCGDAFGSGGRLHTCFHIATPDTAVLVDCGASALIGMRRFGVDPNGIEAVFLSHLHGDHFGGLPWLLLDGQLVSRRTEPLTIVGPPGTRVRLAETMEALFPGSSTAERRFATEVIEVTSGARMSVAGAWLTAYAVSHPSGAPSHALRLELAGKTIAYTGDTAWVEALVEAGRGADLLIAEGYTRDRIVPFHLAWATLRDRLPEIAARRVMLTHMSPEMIAHPPDGYIAAEDGLTLEF